jgi:hypothetical protein
MASNSAAVIAALLNVFSWLAKVSASVCPGVIRPERASASPAARVYPCFAAMPSISAADRANGLA